MTSRRHLLERFGAICAFTVLPSLVITNPANASGGGAPVQESNFILPTQVNGNIMSGGRSVGIMQLDIGVYTTDPDLKARLNALAPVLRANWRAALQEFIVKYYISGTVPDALILTGLLHKTLEPHLGHSRGRILIQSIIARNI